MYSQHKSPKDMIAANPKLRQMVELLAASDPAVLVQEMARKLHDEFTK